MSKFIYILVEGQTEETFVNQVIAPHFAQVDYYLQPVIVKTKNIPGSASYKGGYVTYAALEKELMRLFQPQVALVTTMFDFYGLPRDFPGMRDVPVNKSCFDQVRHVENAWQDSIRQKTGYQRFDANLTLHEFEGLLFSNPAEIAHEFSGKLKDVLDIRNAFQSPEEINDSTETAPNKRLQRLFPEYQKQFHGIRIAQRIGIGRIRAECRHFDAWITRLENL